jgi:hypothetical protein
MTLLYDTYNLPTIRILDADLDEVLNMTAGTSISLDGGYTANYIGKSGNPTILKGPLIITV